MSDNETKLTLVGQLSLSENLSKYKTAGKIASNAMNKIVSLVKPGVKVQTLCMIGDAFINNELKNVYNKGKNINKGIAFPTSININNYAGWYSPVDDTKVIENGEMVKIELGVQIDGFPALLGYTVIVNETKKLENDGDKIDEKPILISDKRAKVIHAVSEASKAILPLFKVGKTNKDVVKCLKKHAEKFGCSLIYVDNPNLHAPGVMSFQMSQNVIDGNNDDDEDTHQMILARNADHYDFVMNEVEFDENEVFCMDVMMSTGNGKISPTMDRVTIFKRNKNFYNLKRKASKHTLYQFKGNKFPMNVRSFNSNSVKLGVIECIQHNLLEPYGVYAEKNGEYIAQAKFTVIVGKKTPILIAGRSSESQLKKVSLN